MLSLDDSPRRHPYRSSQSSSSSSSYSPAYRGGGATPSASSANDAVRGLLRSTSQRSSRNRDVAMREAAERLRAQKESDDHLRFLPRRWHTGEVYAPHDMSPAEMRKWARVRPRQRDLVDVLNVNPVDMYRVSFGLLCSRSLTRTFTMERGPPSDDDGRGPGYRPKLTHGHRTSPWSPST